MKSLLNKIPAKKLLLIVATAFGLVANVQALSVSITPPDQIITVGNSTTVDIFVNGLLTELAGFDLDLEYDATVLSATSLTFGNYLDLGHIEDPSNDSGSFQSPDLSPGLIHLYELSWEKTDKLFAAQSGGTFRLATITFSGSTPGAGYVRFATGGKADLTDGPGNSIPDADGVPASDRIGATINVLAVSAPETSVTGLLLAFSMLSLIGVRTRAGRGLGSQPTTLLR